MKRFKKFLAATLLVLGIFTVASCASKSGVKGHMEASSTKDSITITSYFDSYDEIKNGNANAFIECYTKATTDGEEDTYKSTNSLSFSGDYTNVETKFSSLTIGAKYSFILKVTFNGNDEIIDTEDYSTSPKGGSSEDAIIINSKDEFLAMKEDPTAFYELGKDIDWNEGSTSATEADFDYLFSDSKKFSGGFDGKEHTISNLKLKTATYMGIFGYVAGTKDDIVEIKNVKFTNVSSDITRTTCYLGVVAGYVENAKFSNITVGAEGEANAVKLTLTCNTTAKANVGAVVGKAVNTSFENIKVENTTINLPKARLEARVGLLAGYVDGIVDGDLVKDASITGGITANAYFTDSSKDSAFLYVGGLFGENDCQNTIADANVDAEILITRDSSSTNLYFDLAVAGFIGYANGSLDIKNCVATADVTVYAGQVPTGNDEAAKQENLDKVKAAILSERDVYVAGFIGYLNQNIVGIDNECEYVVKENGITVYGSASTAKQDDDDTKLKGSINVSTTVAGKKESIETSTFEGLTVSADKKYVSAVDVEGDKPVNVFVDDNSSKVKVKATL